MDPTTVLAVICSAVVFVAWLVAPSTPTAVKAAAVPVSEERQPVPVSA
ncbi:MAG TPA: hypothetical protein VJT14_01365 [Candidatus Dormibacteraeota bacterium]|nr:hypothetical protein [Candidatus Dormibacteraeota bacterium]